MPIAAKEIPNLTEKDKARFCSKLSIGEIDQCWEWKAKKFKYGYGMFRLGGRSGKGYMAHRISHLIFKKPPIGNLRVLHRCDNPPCCNPNHLFLGTVGDNNADRHAKGRSKGPIGMANIAVREPQRMSRGEKHGRSKLTNRKVVEIRRRRDCGQTCQFIADAFSVSKKTILNIIHNRIWKHVK